jgi:hypothetical protein
LRAWDSRDRKLDYTKKQWPKRESLITVRKNVVNTPLINPEKVYLPPLYIKLGLKKFHQSVDQNSDGFIYWKIQFATITDAKIKERLLLDLKLDSEYRM